MRVIVVDQNDDARLDAVVDRANLSDPAHHAAPRASRARATSGSRSSRPTSSRSPTTTASIRRDCSSASPRALGPDSGLDGLTGRAEDASGRLRRLVAGRGRDPHRRQPLEPRDLLHDLPPPRARRKRVGSFDEELGPRLRHAVGVGRGDRLPRPRRAGRGAASSTTPRSSWCTTFAQDDVGRRRPRRSEHRLPPAQARLSRCESSSRMLVRPLGGTHRLLAAPRRCARQVLPRDVPRPHPRLPGREALEQLCVTVEPGRERESLDRTPPSRGGVLRQIGEHAGHGVRQRLRRRRLVTLEPVRMRARRCRPRRRPAPGRPRCGRRRPVARTPSPRSRDSGTGRSPSYAGGRGRAGRSPAHRPASSARATCTRPPSPSRSTIGSIGVDEPPRDEELRVGVRREERCERLQPELEPVRLVLVAAEQEHGPALRPAARRREALDVDRVVENLPRPAGRADPLVRGALAELALVEDVLRLRENPAQRAVERLGRRLPPSPDSRRRSDSRGAGCRAAGRARAARRDRAAARSIPGTRSEKSVGWLGKRVASRWNFAVPPATGSPGAGTRSWP